MEKEFQQKKYFFIGTVFLYLAMFFLTIIPNFVANFLPFIYIKINNYIILSAVFFISALMLYLISDKTYKKQIIAIILAFIYFLIYTNLFVD